MALTEDEELELLELENEEAMALRDGPNQPRSAQDSGEALLTNLPTQGIGQDVVRGLPAGLGGMVGGLAGAVKGAALGSAFPGVGTVAGGIAGGILGAGLGGASGEAARQATAQGTAAAFPEANYPVLRPGEVAGQVGIQGAVQAAGQAIGVGAGAAYNAIRPGAVNLGGAAMKVTAGVPENSGVYALDDLGRLGRAPSKETVSGLYDDFHRASGTMSRKESISRSGDPFDSTARAMATMRDAYGKLRSGALSVQEAVEASQAGRIIRDMKSRGVEMAQEVAEQADALKGQFDDFISRGMGPRTVTGEVPVAQGLKPVTRTVANRISPRGEIFETAREIVPEPVNIPVQASENVMPDLRRVVGIVKRAGGEGVNPKSIMTDAERALYEQFKNAVDSSALHSVPIESLIAPSEASRQTAGFAERTFLRPGEPIYAGTYRMGFEAPVERTALLPGEMVMGRGPVQVPAKAGFPEWQTARQAAFERSVADDFGSFFPRNVNGTPNVLRTWSAAGGGATAGMIAGGVLGGPVGAALGGAAGAVGGALGVSPMAYGAAIRATGAVTGAAARIPAGVYRVGTQAGAGGAGSMLQDAYIRQRPAR